MARRLVIVWVALMVLLALTAASAWIPLGRWNSTINLAIALAKALLVALFFMHLAKGSVLPRMVAATALFTLLLLLALTGADYATRHVYPSPWTTPPPGQTGAAAPARANLAAFAGSERSP